MCLTQWTESIFGCSYQYTGKSKDSCVWMLHNDLQVFVLVISLLTTVFTKPTNTKTRLCILELWSGLTINTWTSSLPFVSDLQIPVWVLKPHSTYRWGIRAPYKCNYVCRDSLSLVVYISWTCFSGNSSSRLRATAVPKGLSLDINVRIIPHRR